VKGSCRTGLSNTWRTVVYDVVHPCFDILIFTRYYCPHFFIA